MYCRCLERCCRVHWESVRRSTETGNRICFHSTTVLRWVINAAEQVVSLFLTALIAFPATGFVTVQDNLELSNGWWCWRSEAAKIGAGLAESNGYLSAYLWLIHLWAQLSESAPTQRLCQLLGYCHRGSIGTELWKILRGLVQFVRRRRDDLGTLGADVWWGSGVGVCSRQLSKLELSCLGSVVSSSSGVWVEASVMLG